MGQKRPNGISADCPQPDRSWDQRARAATALMLALPGAYLYQGEELGLPDSTDMPHEFRQDPAFRRTNGEEVGRDGCRVPMPWAKDAPSFGFGPTESSWLLQPAVYGDHAVDQQEGVEGSTLELYRALLAARRERHLGTGGPGSSRVSARTSWRSRTPGRSPREHSRRRQPRPGAGGAARGHGRAAGLRPPRRRWPGAHGHDGLGHPLTVGRRLSRHTGPVRAADFAYLDVPTPIGLAHRGGALHADNIARENTLAAFRTAVRLGYQYLETDVHATADGQLLAFHDSHLDRVTDASGAVAEMPYAAVREARINGTDEILLAHLLEEFPQARINIDVKAAGAVAPLRRPSARTVRSSGSASAPSPSSGCVPCAVSSAATGHCRGTLGVAALRFSPSAVSRWIRTPSPVLQIPPHHLVAGRRVELVTPGLVDTVHRLGKHLHVWTIDDAAEMHRLLDLGVDGIVSDRIDVLADVLASRGAPLGRPVTRE